jgi:Ribonuclease G/E
MEFLNSALQYPFTWGLLAGLLIAGFVWKSGFSSRRQSAKEIRRLEQELRDLQRHLHTQLKIQASGQEAVTHELDRMRQQNETLRMNLALLQQKPGRAELRQLQVQELAVRALRTQAPGFAPAWENALEQAEAELQAGESGLKQFMRRWIPTREKGDA